MNIGIIAMSMHMHIIMLVCFFILRLRSVHRFGELRLILAPPRRIVNAFFCTDV